jgi:septal ring-binding cell division protein DamX
MRFEIKKGGAFLILVALVGLSGAVFALGLVAGYQMAKQNQPDLNQTSTTYPLPAAPTDESKPAPVAEMSPPPAMPIKPAAPPVAAMPPASHASPATVARVRPPAPAPTANPNPPGATDEEDADSEPAAAPAVAPPSSPSRPYNIQIEAVMDKSGADEMVDRLKKLGYNAQEMTTNLNGQTWYRVRVGPYNSSAEAAAAQAKLRDQYKAAYTTSH